MININHILEGWGNLIKDKFDLLSEEKKKASEKKLLFCDTCPLRKDNTCSTKRQSVVIKDFYYKTLKEYRKKGQLVKGCGCNLSAKSLCDECQCPRGLWENI